MFGGPKIVTDAEGEQQANAGSFLTIADTNPAYHFVDTAEKRQDLLSKLLAQKSVCFDTETTALDEIEAEIVGMSFSFEKNTGYYVSTPADQRAAIVQEFKAFFENEAIEKVAHNIKYDLKIIEKYGIEVKGPQFDTMIAHYLITPEGKHGMDYLAELYLNYRPISIETLIGKKGKTQGNMGDLDPKGNFRLCL